MGSFSMPPRRVQIHVILANASETPRNPISEGDQGFSTAGAPFGTRCFASYAASVAAWIGSTIEGSSFSGLLTRVEIAHIRMRSAGKGRISEVTPVV
jgi:hypothetical protein